MSSEVVIGLVAEHYECDMGEFLRCHNRGSEARQVAMYLVTTFCRGRHSPSDWADRLGNLTVGGLCAAHYRIAGRLKSVHEGALRENVEALVRRLAETDEHTE